MVRVIAMIAVMQVANKSAERPIVMGEAAEKRVAVEARVKAIRKLRGITHCKWAGVSKRAD